MRKVIFFFLKWTLVLAFFIVGAFGALDVYFTHFSKLQDRILASTTARVKQYNIHTLTYAQIPTTFRQAIIATEDRRFESDPGIDPIGIARSLFVDLQKDGYVEGGSTITQQLVDNTLLNQQKTIQRKLLQAFYAVGIYDVMSKQQTFSLYANVIYFGHGAYGLYNAAKIYFDKEPRQLNAGQLTLLAGIPNSPSNFDPLRNLSLARERQQTVVQNMVDVGVISQAQATNILREPLQLIR